MNNELIIDSFAGGGGASLGIAWALGRCPDIAINHDESAIAMHAANHPSTEHVLEDVWKADLRSLVGDRDVGLLWASPDCKHFSRAKGGKPVEKRIRSLAWIVCRWADQVRPRMIALENVREFADWGPLVPRWTCSSCGWKGTEGQTVLARTRRKCPSCESRKLVITEELVPCPKRKGLTFKRFVGRLRNLGYDVQWRNLDAADYGAPTHRKRLFLIARCDGQPIVWPEPTHASPEKIDAMPLFNRLEPYRTAAECIDWSIECPSIFERSKPLADKTMRRIALGIKRYVIDNPQPFIVQTSHTGTTGRGSYVWSTDEPTRTISQSNEFAVVSPIVSRYNGSKTDTDDRCQQFELPISTLDTQPRFAVVSPTLVSITHDGDRKPIDPNAPLPTVTTAHRGEMGLAAATLVRQFGKSDAVDVGAPMPTTTAGGGGKTGLLAATLVQSGYGERDGQSPRVLDIEQPHGTVVADGVKSALVSAFVAKHFGGMVGVEADSPLPTTTMRGTQNQLVAANLVHLNHGAKQWSGCDEPARTVTTGNHAALVYSFMVKYFGTAIGTDLSDPMPTSTGKDRFGLVTVLINGEPYVIVDIGMRMLTPRELARAQGFPDTYQLTGTKTSQVARIGNSVCPQVAAAIVSANCTAETLVGGTVR
jgi:DNA (cytosine-5)-methyltransferase 1